MYYEWSLGGDMEVNVVVVERYFLENIKILIKQS